MIGHVLSGIPATGKHPSAKPVNEKWTLLLKKVKTVVFNKLKKLKMRGDRKS